MSAENSDDEKDGTRPRIGNVERLSAKIENSVVFPLYSHRPGNTLDTNVPEQGLNDLKETTPEGCEDSSDEVENSDCEVPPMVVVTQNGADMHNGEITGTLENAIFLSPHRFGSIDEGPVALRWREDDSKSVDSCGSEDLLVSLTEEEEEEEKKNDSETTSTDVTDVSSVATDTSLSDYMRSIISIDSTVNFQHSVTEDFVDFIWNEKKHPPPKLPPCPEGLSKDRQKRRYIMENILSTEQSYIKALKSLVQDFDVALEEMNPPIISHKDRRRIFYKLRNLLQIHRSFQISLEICAEKWDQEERAGDFFTACFSRETVREVYASFINNYNDASERVKFLSQINKSFAAFLAERQRTGETRLPLVGLMVKPIQRFPQFIMLLQDLIKNTPEDHSDYCALQQALTEIESLANHLNERKKDAEEEAEAKKLMKQLKLRLPDSKQNNKPKILNRTKVLFNRYSKTGRLKTQHEQELITFDTMIMCCTSAPDDHLKLEWAALLDRIKIEDTNITPDMKISVNRDSLGQTTITSHKTNVGFTADDPNAQSRLDELQSLIHDHTVLGKIITIASTLNYSYRGFDENALQSISTSLHRSIQQKADENRLIDSSLLTLKIGRSEGRFKDPTTHIFQLPSPSARNTWVNQFVHARLCQEPTNENSWYLHDSTVVRNSVSKRLLNSPLFIANMAVDISRSLGEVNCAVPVCLVYGSILKRHVWCCHANAGVTILSVYNHTPTILQNFTCDSLPHDTSFWCVDVVPGCMEATDLHYQADMVWIGTSNCLILLFSLLEAERQHPFFQIATESPVVSLCYADDRVYAGLLNGAIRIFSRDASGVWYSGESVEVGVSAVVKIAKVPNTVIVLAACDSKFIKITPDEEEFEMEVINLDPPEEASCGHVQDFVVSETTAWIAFQDSLILQLFHLKTYKIIQTVHLKRTLESLKRWKGYQQEDDDSITCLCLVKGLLMIGTRGGFICKFNVPKFESRVLKSISPCAVSLHKHIGPVRFITAFQNLMEQLIESVNFEYDDHNEADMVDTSVVNTSEEDSSNCMHNISENDKPAAELVHTRRISMTPLTNKWLSNPNLLLNLQAETEEKIDKDLGNLMIAFHSMEGLDEDFEEKSNEIEPRVTSVSIKSDSHNSSPVPPKEQEKQVILDEPLIVTGGLGYLDLDSERGGMEEESEGCIMSWCE